VFGLFGSGGSSRRNPHAAVEDAVKHAHRVWDSADVETRAKLLEKAIEIREDRMFLALVNATWTQLPEPTRLKITGVLIKRDSELSFVKTAARHMGEIVGDSYSLAEFDAMFGNQKYDARWSRECALGVWFGLGRFCLFISIGQLSRLKEQDFDAAINAGQSGLLSKWTMSEVTRNTYERFGADKIPLMLPMYRLINDNGQLRLFFTVLISDILGSNSNVSVDDFSNGFLALALRGVRMDVDPSVLSRVSTMFGAVGNAVQEFDKMLPL
jgi:hypothetical protein